MPAGQDHKCREDAIEREIEYLNDYLAQQTTAAGWWREEESKQVTRYSALYQRAGHIRRLGNRSKSCLRHNLKEGAGSKMGLAPISDPEMSTEASNIRLRLARKPL